MGRSLGLVPETVAAATGALEEDWVSDCNLVALSPPRAGKYQTHTWRDLDA